MQKLKANTGFKDWGPLRRPLLSLWKDALVVAILAVIGASAAEAAQCRGAAFAQLCHDRFPSAPSPSRPF